MEKRANLTCPSWKRAVSPFHLCYTVCLIEKWQWPTRSDPSNESSSKLKLSPITHKRRHRGLIVHHTWEPNSTRPRNLNRALFKIRRKRTWSSLIGPKNRVRIFSLLATWNRWMESVRSFRKLARLEFMLFNSISRAFNWENVYERSVRSLRRAGFPGERSPDSSWVNCAIYGLVLATVRCGCWMAASRTSPIDRARLRHQV